MYHFGGFEDVEAITKWDLRTSYGTLNRKVRVHFGCLGQQKLTPVISKNAKNGVFKANEMRTCLKCNAPSFLGCEVLGVCSEYVYVATRRVSVRWFGVSLSFWWAGSQNRAIRQHDPQVSTDLMTLGKFNHSILQPCRMSTFPKRCTKHETDSWLCLKP